MNSSVYEPTDQQRRIIEHAGAAFITACPGAGKTRTLVERARRRLAETGNRSGVAFLSFTNASVNELETRLRAFGVLPNPLFPSFIGTFDRFLWQFLIVPFGIKGCAVMPQLVPDKTDWEVRPYNAGQPLPLSCFNRTTGKIDAALAKEEGFDAGERLVGPYENLARLIINNAWRKGLVDFQDVRVCVQDWLDDAVFAKGVGAALAARFGEIIVDEAQDCNSADLTIVDWLRRARIPVKMICDPNQSIYAFRGGVTDQLLRFSDTFDTGDRLPMSGNFRSTPAICAAIAALRQPASRSNPDQPLGPFKSDPTPVHIFAYGGKGVSSAIGQKFRELVLGLDIQLSNAPVLSSTRRSACKAIGQPILEAKRHKTLLLAQAATNYHFAFAIGNRRDALERLHCIVLLVQGAISSQGEYRRYIVDQGLEDGRWRSDVIAVANELRFESPDTADQWLRRAQDLLAWGPNRSSIKQRLRAHSDLVAALKGAPVDSPPARTIHSAKGMEFPAVCVVLTSSNAGKILDHLQGQSGTGHEEDARKIYVGASRAERLLTLAVPNKQAGRFKTLLASTGCSVVLYEI